MTATYHELVSTAAKRFGVPEMVVQSFLRDEGVRRASAVTPEIAARVLKAMEAEDERLNQAF